MGPLAHPLDRDVKRDQEQANSGRRDHAGGDRRIDVVACDLRGALSREPQRKRELAKRQARSCGGRTLPLRRRVVLERARRATGDEVALEIEHGVDGSVGGEDALGGSLLT